MVNYDDILRLTGKFGWFETRTFVFVCLATLLGCMQTFTQVFIAGKGDHWCRAPKLNDEECTMLNYTTDQCRDLFRPLDDNGKDFSKCQKYNLSGLDHETILANRDNLTSYGVVDCDEGWIFDTSVYPSTLTEEWELVCDKEAVPNFLQSVYLAGFVVGCLLFGYLADKIGRYYSFCICAVGTAAFGILTTLSPNPIIFGALRFLVAACSYGLVLVLFVVATEMVLPHQRVYVGIFLWYPYVMGYFVLVFLGKFLNSWRLFVVLAVTPYITMVPGFFLVKESPRWLLTKGLYEEANEVIAVIAKTNKKEIPAGYLTKLQEDQEATKPEEKASIVYILRHPILALYLINLMFNWFVQSFVYYGLSLGTSSLGVDVYIAFSISGAVEFPAYLSSMLTMKYLGRKTSTGCFMILAGLACFATIPAPQGPIRVAVAMVGKFAISASFSNIYVHTAEIFPTPARTLCIGVCSVAARVGGLIAPLILVLENTWQSLPLICFASSSVLAGVLVFFLPETKGKLMPDTIEDTLKLRKTYVNTAEDSENDPNEKKA